MASLRQKLVSKAFQILNRKGLLNGLSDERYIRLRWRLTLGGQPDLKSPKTFNEKMQWLKLHDRRAECTRMVDKYEAKAYVAEKLGGQYIVPCLGVWDRFEEIDFDALPERFVLKCTHDSGGLVICRDKAALDREKAKRKISSSLARNFYHRGREWQYKDVRPRVLAEEYLENDADRGLYDYKVWCFGGEPRYVQYITGRLGGATEAFYDPQWVRQNFTFHNPPMQGEAERPERLEELLTCCRTLAQGQPFVRVDFYILPDGTLRFGELTFCPMMGFERFTPPETDRLLGDMIPLP